MSIRIILICLSISILSCKKGPMEDTSTTVTGKILYKDNNPVLGAKIFFGDKTLNNYKIVDSTRADGSYRFSFKWEENKDYAISATNSKSEYQFNKNIRGGITKGINNNIDIILEPVAYLNLRITGGSPTQTLWFSGFTIENIGPFTGYNDTTLTIEVLGNRKTDIETTISFSTGEGDVVKYFIINPHENDTLKYHFQY